jgi:hemolysin-activating ACP:hemolysin acyltransferase
MAQKGDGQSEALEVEASPEWAGAADALQDPEQLKRLAPEIARVRLRFREGFGNVVLSMMALPRYRHIPVGDLQHLVFEPLTRDRIAFAYAGDRDDPLTDMAGFALWASVSDAVEQRIREQIREGVFPVRLTPQDWISGKNNWLLDVIAPTPQIATAVIANFGKVAKGGALRLHPIVTRLIDEDTLKKLGAERLEPAPSGSRPVP